MCRDMSDLPYEEFVSYACSPNQEHISYKSHGLFLIVESGVYLHSKLPIFRHNAFHSLTTRDLYVRLCYAANFLVDDSIIDNKWTDKYQHPSGFRINDAISIFGTNTAKVQFYDYPIMIMRNKKEAQLFVQNLIRVLELDKRWVYDANWIFDTKSDTSFGKTTVIISRDLQGHAAREHFIMLREYREFMKRCLSTKVGFFEFHQNGLSLSVLCDHYKTVDQINILSSLPIQGWASGRYLRAELYGLLCLWSKYLITEIDDKWLEYGLKQYTHKDGFTVHWDRAHWVTSYEGDPIITDFTDKQSAQLFVQNASLLSGASNWTYSHTRHVLINSNKQQILIVPLGTGPYSILYNHVNEHGLN